MKQIFKYLKPLDYVLILIAVLLSFVPLLVTHWVYQGQADSDQLLAVVKIKGQIVDEFILRSGAGQRLETYHPGPDQYNIVEQVDNQIRVKEDNSPDQIAVKTGWISRPGQVSVCLPHNLLIEVRGQPDEDELILPFPNS